jgi:ABC-type Zn uptake system ZnuABC Zn-binding protein ZnuA
MEIKRIILLLLFFSITFIYIKYLNFSKIQISVNDDIVFDIVKNLGKNKVEVIKSENPLISLKEKFDYENFWIPIEKLKLSAYEILIQLEKIDPKNKAYYERNYYFYLNKLVKFDNSIKEKIQNLENKNIIAYSNFIDDFAKNYGLNILCYIESLKSPNEILNCFQIVKDKKPKAILILPKDLNKISEQYSKLLNLKLVILKPIKTGEYLNIMEDNFNMIYNSLNE